MHTLTPGARMQELGPIARKYAYFHLLLPGNRRLWNGVSVCVCLCLCLCLRLCLCLFVSLFLSLSLSLSLYAELMTHNKGAVYKTMFYCGLSSVLRGASVLFLNFCLHGTAVLKGVQIFLKCRWVLRSGLNTSQQQNTVLKGVEENIFYTYTRAYIRLHSRTHLHMHTQTGMQASLHTHINTNAKP